MFTFYISLLHFISLHFISLLHFISPRFYLTLFHPDFTFLTSSIFLLAHSTKILSIPPIFSISFQFPTSLLPIPPLPISLYLLILPPFTYNTLLFHFNLSNSEDQQELLTVPDTITEWVVSAFSTHAEKGLGVSKPAHVIFSFITSFL